MLFTKQLGQPRYMLENRLATRRSAAVPLLRRLRLLLMMLLLPLLLLLPAELMDLRQKFEEGRKRLAALKAARHFRPS
jgi:hypothetical protein